MSQLEKENSIEKEFAQFADQSAFPRFSFDEEETEAGLEKLTGYSLNELKYSKFLISLGYFRVPVE